MSRRAMGLLLATMAAALVVASGVTLAQTPGGTLDANTLLGPHDDNVAADRGGIGTRAATEVAQTFTAVNTGEVASARAMVFLQYGTPSDVTMKIADVDALGRPGAVLGTAVIPAAEVPGDEGYDANTLPLITGKFESPVGITAGQKYALILDIPTSDGNAGWVFNGVTPYDGGRSWFKFKTEPDWDPWGGPDPDLIFAIYLGGSTTPTDDTTDPVLGLPADITQQAVDANGAPVNFEVSATDNEDPDPQVGCERGTPPTAVSSGATFALGTTTVTCTATDAAGNTATGSFDVTVLFSGFSGFFPPVENAPTLNVVKAPAGKAAIHVKFSLGGDMGFDIFEEGYPLSKSTPCPDQSPTDVVEETVAAEPSNLKYDAGANQYVYTWKTDSAWKGTCRELNLRLKDGTDHKAVFQFTK